MNNRKTHQMKDDGSKKGWRSIKECLCLCVLTDKSQDMDIGMVPRRTLEEEEPSAEEEGGGGGGGGGANMTSSVPSNDPSATVNVILNNVMGGLVTNSIFICFFLFFKNHTFAWRANQ